MAKKITNKIIHGDCLEVLPGLPRAKMIFADPPDNIGMKYRGYDDDRPECHYNANMWCWLRAAQPKADILWFSIASQHLTRAYDVINRNACLRERKRKNRLFIWRYTFGQHNQRDCGQGYRPIIRLRRPGAKLYPASIRVPSARQTTYNDKRANPKGRVPDDVWDFPRVCGTFKERRKWFPNQHPEALIERVVKLSTKRGDLVIDMFAGSGTVHRVCKRLGRNSISIEISQYYVKKIRGDK